jgi:hypothetical protein
MPLGVNGVVNGAAEDERGHGSAQAAGESGVGE